jgi:hypothetical protein
MRAIVGVFLLCAIGCGDDAEDRECTRCDLDASIDAAWSEPDASPPAAGFTAVTFVPEPNTRWMADAGLGLTVLGFDLERPKDDVVRELAGALELVRWPSSERLAVQITWDATIPERGFQLALMPDEGLVAGEYALRLNPTPPRVFVLRASKMGGLDVGRFTVGP